MSDFDYSYRHSANKSSFNLEENLFSLGFVVQTPGAYELEQSGIDLSQYLKRHASGDWGDLCEEDKQSNNEALKEGYFILSSYNLDNNKKLWIQTEWDRSVTTIMLPGER